MAKRKGKRKSTVKYPTIKAQGPSSWVEFDVPTWEEARDAINHVRKEGRGMIKRHFDTEKGVRLEPTENFLPEEAEAALVDMLWELTVSKFRDWNWCDDEGNDLPPASEMDPGELLQTELGVVLELTQDLFGIKDLEEEGKARR